MSNPRLRYPAGCVNQTELLLPTVSTASVQMAAQSTSSGLIGSVGTAARSVGSEKQREAQVL